MTRSTTVALVLFVGLAVVAAILLYAASAMSDAFAQAVLIQMGSVVFGSGLTVFLLRLLSTADRA
jgi:hypothetical protein